MSSEGGGGSTLAGLEKSWATGFDAGTVIASRPGRSARRGGSFRPFPPPPPPPPGPDAFNQTMRGIARSGSGADAIGTRAPWRISTTSAAKNTR